MKNPTQEIPVNYETETLECPIFDEDGEQIGEGEIEVTYYKMGYAHVITEINYNIKGYPWSACHPDDAYYTITSKFPNVTFEL